MIEVAQRCKPTDFATTSPQREHKGKCSSLDWISWSIFCYSSQHSTLVNIATTCYKNFPRTNSGKLTG